MRESPRTILVVDDDEEILLITSTYLADLGHTVLKATNGNEGLRILEEHPDIDLLFTDIVMPGDIDGFELAHRAIQMRLKLRASTRADLSGICRGAKKGVGYGRLLSKPWRAQTLADELARAFNDPMQS